MKQLFLVLATVAAMSVTADMKLGSADLVLLVRNHPDYDRNKTLLETTASDYEKKLTAIKGEGEKLQSEGKKLAEQYRNPMLNDKAKTETEKQLQDIQMKLMQIEQRYRAQALTNRQELGDLEGRLLKATTEDLRKRIKKFAEKGGYDFIFDKAAAPYAKDSYDVTNELLKDMGVNPAEAKGRNESK